MREKMKLSAMQNKTIVLNAVKYNRCLNFMYLFIFCVVILVFFFTSSTGLFTVFIGEDAKNGWYMFRISYAIYMNRRLEYLILKIKYASWPVMRIENQRK